MAVNLCIFPIFLPVLSLVTVLNVKLNKYADKRKKKSFNYFPTTLFKTDRPRGRNFGGISIACEIF